MHRFGLSPARSFWLAELDDHRAGAATIWPEPGTAYCIASPNLLVQVDVSADIANAIAGPSLTLSLAGGIRDRLSDIGVTDALTRPVHLVLDAHQPPPAALADAKYPYPAGETADRMRVARAEQPGAPQITLILTLPPDWFTLVYIDPQRATAECGRRLLDALQPFLPAPSYDSQAAWQDAGPLLVTSLEANPLAPRRTVTQIDSASAERSAWQAITTTDVPPGIRTGQDAKTLANDLLYPAALNRLSALTERFDHTETLIETFALLNDCLGQQHQRRDDIHFGLAGPWAETVQADALGTGAELLALSRDAQALIEHLHTHPGAPSRELAAPDRFDLTDLLAAARVAVVTGDAAHLTGPALADLSLVIIDGGLPLVRTPLAGRPSSEPSHARSIDLTAFSLHTRAHQYRIDSTVSDPAQPAVPGQHPFRPIIWKDLPGSYLQVEHAMISELGAGMDAINAVLADLTCRLPNYGTLLMLDPAATAADIANWAQLVPLKQIDAAVALLSLPAEFEQDWWRMEKRTHRLLTQPLLEHDGGLLTAPHLLATTHILWSGYFSVGRLMWPNAGAKVNTAVNKLAQRGGPEFERLLANTLTPLGWPQKTSIKLHELNRMGIAAGGEIDILTADVTRRRIWLIEAKTSVPPHAVTSMQGEVQHYHRTDGYVDHVLDNLTALRTRPDLTASILGLDGDDWSVEPLIVTRHVSPAAFIANPRVPFTIRDDLIDVITREDVPKPGHAPIGARRH